MSLIRVAKLSRSSEAPVRLALSGFESSSFYDVVVERRQRGSKTRGPDGSEADKYSAEMESAGRREQFGPATLPALARARRSAGTNVTRSRRIIWRLGQQNDSEPADSAERLGAGRAFRSRLNDSGPAPSIRVGYYCRYPSPRANADPAQSPAITATRRSLQQRRGAAVLAGNRDL